MIVNYCTYITVKPADLRANALAHTFHTHSHKETMHWHFLWAECGIMGYHIMHTVILESDSLLHKLLVSPVCSQV